MNEKHLWYTDTHFKPWTRHKVISCILKEKPKAIFLTGDISYGPTLIWDLEVLAKKTKVPIYFVLGNHDYHFSNIASVHSKIRKLCSKYSNLIWMTESGVVSLNKDTALIGGEGWYDIRIGNPKFIKFTFDWFMTSDFKKLPTMEDRFTAFRKLADESAAKLPILLETALQTNKTVYLLTHFPPWEAAHRAEGTWMEEFWLPYNVNLALGKALEEVMARHLDKKLIVLAGHTHTDCWIHVSDNLECRVNKAKYTGVPRNEERIYISG